MNIIRPIILPMLLLPLLAYSQSKYLQTPEEARKAAEGIVASIAAENYNGAWKELKPLSVVPATEIDLAMAQLNSQQTAIVQRFGSPIGYEFLREEKLGTSVVRYTFIVRHEKAPMRWLLTFYRAKKGWVSTDFKFDGNIADSFTHGS